MNADERRIRRVATDAAVLVASGATPSEAVSWAMEDLPVIGACVECGLNALTIGLWPDRLDLCFKCGFWREKVKAHSTDPRWFIAGGRSYFIGPEGERFRGFGGATANVYWFDPERAALGPTTTSNLWCQGTVPEWFRGRLPDTASLEWA